MIAACPHSDAHREGRASHGPLSPGFYRGCWREALVLLQTMVNEKFRENVPAWTGFSAHMDKFPAFFSRVVKLQSSERAWQTHERVTYILFFIHAFQSLEQEAVRKQALKLVSLPLWYSLSRGRLQVAHPFTALLLCALRVTRHCFIMQDFYKTNLWTPFCFHVGHHMLGHVFASSSRVSALLIIAMPPVPAGDAVARDAGQALAALGQERGQGLHGSREGWQRACACSANPRSNLFVTATDRFPAGEDELSLLHHTFPDIGCMLSRSVMLKWNGSWSPYHPASPHVNGGHARQSRVAC